MILLQSESLGGKCAKLHTVAASNNRDHMPWWRCSIIAYLCHIYVGVVLHTSRSWYWWITHATQHQLRGCSINIHPFITLVHKILY